MTAFALLVTTLMSYVSYELITYFQRKTAIQATEFNLQLVSHIIEQDLLNLSLLAMTSSTNSSTNTLLAKYFAAPEPSSMDAVEVFSSMQEDFRANRANNYVRRLIVTDHLDKFFQVDNLGSTSLPLTIHNLRTLPGLTATANEQWEQVMKDPLSNTSTLPFVLPIYGEGSARIGTVYLLANTSVITDKLKGYALPANSQLLLTLGERQYVIHGGQIVPAPTDYRISEYRNEGATGALTHVSLLETGEDKRQMAVSYPIREGITLSQTLSEKEFVPQFNIWLMLVVGVVLLVIVLSAIITYYLTRTISLPVEKLKKRIDKIAQGNFLVDRNIEWNSELGDIGRGINRLSQDIVALLETRLADEKQRQDLEYRMLQNQINPHFLYNTLNSIKWMATIQNATGIAEMTTSLSRLLRSIAKDPRRLVALRDELSLLDDYFLIQKYRYGSHITMEQHLEDEEILSCLIPRFTLQPLLENAIFHGIEPKGQGHIIIRIEREGIREVAITIEDNGVGLTDDQITGILSPQPPEANPLQQSVGIHSVNERLMLTFGHRYGLSIESSPGAYTRMKLLIPNREEQRP